MADLIFNLLKSAIEFLEMILSEIINFTAKSGVYFSNANPVWSNIMNLVSGTAFGLVVVFTYIHIIKTTLTIHDTRRIEPWVEPFLRFTLTVGIVLSAPLLIQWIADIGSGLVTTLLSGTAISPDFSSTKSIIEVWSVTAPFGTQWLANIGILIVILIIYVLILTLGVMIVVAILTRQFKLMIYAAISPLALAQASAEQTQQGALNFLRKFAALALQGFIIIVVVNLYSQMPRFIDVSSSIPDLPKHAIVEEVLKEAVEEGDVGRMAEGVRELWSLALVPRNVLENMMDRIGLTEEQKAIVFDRKTEAEEWHRDHTNPPTVEFGTGITAIALDVAMLVVFTAILRQSEHIANDLVGAH